MIEQRSSRFNAFDFIDLLFSSQLHAIHHCQQRHSLYGIFFKILVVVAISCSMNFKHSLNDKSTSICASH